MDVGKSVRIAMASEGINQTRLAERIGITRQSVSHICKQKTANSKYIDRLAKAFDMKASDFIALGED